MLWVEVPVMLMSFPSLAESFVLFIAYYKAKTSLISIENISFNITVNSDDCQSLIGDDAVFTNEIFSITGLLKDLDVTIDNIIGLM
ncbi:MAG: hypothetical protein CVU54_00535 [Deltaproteobacteria bacterium HGW-Deltaproteobacteria-12]|jgi:hypothetical protein|nr:MAG: hypothetical protein CVU54_00535 [Deltaproteobacteria bacterium HGW-Deltaproteobacteria-12]